MRVIFHTDQYYPAVGAGSLRIHILAETFMAHGDEVTVITSSANKAGCNLNNEVHKERILYAPTVQMKKKTTVMRMLNSLSFGITSAIWAFVSGKTDVVITTSIPPNTAFAGWLIAKCKGAKLIYDVRDIWPDVAVEMGSFTGKSFYYKVFRAVTYFMYRHADAITTVSAGKVEKIKNYVASLPGKKSGPAFTEKVWLVGNGFDERITESEYDPLVVSQYSLDKYNTCVYIGNIGLAQGLDALLDIAANTRHRDVRFLCFGTGAEEDLLKKRLEDERLNNVKMCGVIEHCKVFSILSHAKISFVPLKSSNMKDSVPTKLYEAMGLGCPVLLAAEGDAAAVVDDVGLGCHVSPEDRKKLIEVFDDMLDRIDEFDGKREEAIRVIRDRYSRQSKAESFYIRLHQLCGCAYLEAEKEKAAKEATMVF